MALEAAGAVERRGDEKLSLLRYQRKLFKYVFQSRAERGLQPCLGKLLESEERGISFWKKRNNKKGNNKKGNYKKRNNKKKKMKMRRRNIG